MHEFGWGLQRPRHDTEKGTLKTLEGLGAQAIDVDIENFHGNISAQLTIEAVETSTFHQRGLRGQPED